MNSLKILLLLILSLKLNAQTVFGTNNYIEYKIGNIPIIISAPHGGNIAPLAVPDRTCNNPTTVTDANTIDLARQIDTAMFQLTGCKIHLILCHLKRTKIDCNRNIADGTCGNSAMQTAWNEYHNFIDTAEKKANIAFTNKSFYIDLHGHGNPIQRLELGYLLTSTELGYSNSVLNTPTYINYSSIRNLVSTNINAYTHSQLLRDSFALGTYFGNSNYPAVPSLQIPSPGTNNNYFNGGYSTVIHTSNTASIVTNGVQIECNFTNVRDTYISRKKFADSTAKVLVKYFLKHNGINLVNACLTTATPKQVVDAPQIFPTILYGDRKIFLRAKNFDGIDYTITNAIGSIVDKGKVIDNQLNLSVLKPGVYFLYFKKYSAIKFFVME